MAQRQVKKVYKSHRAALVFLSICDGKQTLNEMSKQLKIGTNTLQLYLKQLNNCGLISRRPRNPVTKGNPKTWINPYLYYISLTNLREFCAMHIINDKVLGSGTQWYLVPFAEEFLPALARHFFREKKWFVKKINLAEIFEIFHSSVVFHQMHKKHKSKEEKVFLPSMISRFLHPEAFMLNVDFKTKLNKYTIHELAERLESEGKKIHGKQINTL